jgi:hypothetical protein
MKCSAKHNFVLLASLVLSAAALSMAQETNKTIKKVPITQTSAGSGKEMFNAYCASCHGASGKGDGPAASEFKTPPANLTIICPQSQCGKFPNGYISQVLENGVQNSKGHGSKDMPVWGPLFSALSGASASKTAEVQLRINNLSKYIESIQVK